MRSGASGEGPRSIEMRVEIQAPVEAVWKALTEAEELTRWFPLDARVRPGAGGAIWMSWRNEYQFETPIEVWEPNRHLRLVYAEATPEAEESAGGAAPIEGEEAGEGAGAGAARPRVPHRVAVDYYLEGKGGTTVVRLVHSGFSRDAAWDEQFEATVRGWRFQLGGLRTYLERHRGHERQVIYVRSYIPQVSRAEAWEGLLGPRGLAVEGGAASLRAGERYALRIGAERLSGEVDSVTRPAEMSGSIEEMNHALLRVQFDELFGMRDAAVFISAFEVAEGRIARLREELRVMFERQFGRVCA